jgi:hypothetical protein
MVEVAVVVVLVLVLVVDVDDSFVYYSIGNKSVVIETNEIIMSPAI